MEIDGAHHGANTWKGPTKAKRSNDRISPAVLAVAQTANALEPGAEIVLRKNAGHREVRSQ